jgi:hypothetical protein
MTNPRTKKNQTIILMRFSFFYYFKWSQVQGCIYINMAHMKVQKRKLSGSLTNNSLDREIVRQWTKKKTKLSIIFHLFVIEFTLVKHKRGRERRLISFGQYRRKKKLVFILVQRVWIKTK